jgi:EAL domain-containing protein (putative c-di-GMP-specific phosphodiesterase class I)/GGDEF domain-containing protein
MTLSANKQPLTAGDAGKLASCNEFHRLLESQLTRLDASNELAVLMVSLRRSDRLATLLQDAASIAASLQLTERIAAVLRPSDRFIMASEDECWLLLPGLASEQVALLAVHRLLDALRPPVVVFEHTVFVRPCIGVAFASRRREHDAFSASRLLRAADLAQQEARAEHMMFSVSDECAERDDLPAVPENALQSALQNNELTVVYQPKVELASKRAVSVEALVRWPIDHPHAMSATLIIETAERSGLIEPLTLHVFNTVLRQRQEWQRLGLKIDVWVNLSARMLAQRHLPQMLLQILQVWDTPPSAIGFEITESALIHDIDQTTETLFELQRMGFSLAIDDFGTGYSSLAYLRRFPIVELKIDRLFITNMIESRSDHQIVQSIIDLAHNFGLKVVAEGAELTATVPELQRMGCDLVQGFIYARPMPSEQLVGWWREFNRR